MIYNVTVHQAGSTRKKLCPAFTSAISLSVSQRQVQSVLEPDVDGTSIRDTYMRAKPESYLTGKYSDILIQD